jgi:MSHA pilin protein MshD
MYTCDARLSVASCRRQRGVTLIELVMFIVIVGIAVAGILVVYTNTVRHSADPLIRKQMLAVAEAMLEEAKLMPFTYCDPDDANAATAGAAVVGVGDCAATVETMGPEAGETRYVAATPFDNINDYAGFDTATAIPSGIADLSGTVIGGLAGYQAQVAAITQSLGPGGGLIAAVDGNGAPQVLQITVTVTASGGDSVSLSGYRARYAPNAVP